MKVLIVGDWHSELHEEAVFRALKQLGHDPIRFGWHEYFKPNSRLSTMLRPFYKAQNKYLLGPIVSKINLDIEELVKRQRPDLVFFYRGTHILPDTLRAIRRVSPRPIVVSYNNDDPFSPRQPRWLWRHFMASLPECDLVLAYRHHNIKNLLLAGAKRVELLRSWFIPERNHPVTLTDGEYRRYGSDVVFVGHYESDERVAYLEEVVRKGWRLRLFGPGYDWDPVVHRSAQLRGLEPVRLVWGEEYNLALCGAKIALCFLSKLNRDTYTRRCFEIPATRTLMLAEYTDDLATLFREGEEVEFFRNREEMIAKISRYLSDEERRLAVAEAGYRRVLADGHDVASRMRQLMSWVAEIPRRAA
ncbi:MAG: glycosyltransferase [Nitrospira sp.]